MAEERKKSRWTGLIAGPIISFLALTAIWKNETRFDFHRAAKQTQVVAAPPVATSGQCISLTGAMDPGLTIPGDYVEAFHGYLQVQRSAEIYAWDRDKDSDGHVKWSMHWMSSLESNSRNDGVRQELSSKTLHPADYRVGDLDVTADEIEFVDDAETITPGQLKLRRGDLVPEGNYVYLHKHHSSSLGDERLSYRGIPVPRLATYFGKFESGRGVPDASQRRTGMVNSLIQDTGILHHIVAGDRDTALATMKSYLGRLKWIVRGVGTVAVVLGGWIFLATILGWLYHIPVLGRVAEFGSFLAAVIIGIPLALLTILLAYLFAHPLLLFLLFTSATAGMFWIRSRGTQSQKQVQSLLTRDLGHPLTLSETKELEFLELAQLAMSDGEWADSEATFLRQWARKHRWDETKYEQMLQRAKQQRLDSSKTVTTDDHFLMLIRLALADGTLSAYEMQSIRTMARKLKYDDATLRELMRRVRNAAQASPLTT